jgi:hypothetical protein
MTACFSLPDCFSACKTTQELPVTQLARHVNLFHLVIADNRRPETLSLPHGSAPSIKPTTQFTQVAVPRSGGGGSPAVWTNKPFLSTCGMVFIRQYLTLCIFLIYLKKLILHVFGPETLEITGKFDV